MQVNSTVVNASLEHNGTWVVEAELTAPGQALALVEQGPVFAPLRDDPRIGPVLDSVEATLSAPEDAGDAGDAEQP